MILLTGALILRIVSNPLGNVFQKKLTARGYSPLTVNLWTFFLLLLLCLIPAWSVHWSEFSRLFWFYCVIAGCLGAIGNALLVMAVRGGELSVLGPINSWKSIIGLLFGILLLHEWPAMTGLVGTILVLCGSALVLDAGQEQFLSALMKNREIQYRVGAMILTAIEAIYIKRIVLMSSPAVSFYVWCAFGTIFSLVLCLLCERKQTHKTKNNLSHTKRGDLFMFAGLVACMGTMQFCTNEVFQRMFVGYALTLFQLSSLLGIFFGFRFFNETRIISKTLGAVTMIGGSAIIILFA